MSYALRQREREQPLKKGQCLGSNDMRDVRMCIGTDLMEWIR